jgi:hypothetical protein
MHNRTEWSEKPQERTWDVLERVDIGAFSFSMTGKKEGVRSTISKVGMDTSRSLMPSAGIGGCSMMRRICCCKPMIPSME